jgi:hypothetical protein
MKPNRKQTLIGAAVVIALAGGSYGAYTYISGLPKRLNKEEAAKRYLEIVCPGNALVPELNAIEIKAKSAYDEAKRIESFQYYGDEALADATRRRDALWKESISEMEKAKTLLMKRRDLEKQAAQKFADPNYVWPDDVKDEIKKAASAKMESASHITDRLSGGSVIGNKDDLKVFSTIRLRLGLGERNTGCPKDAAKAKKV